ncbi:hypothetical protein AUJ16_00455 [Candidatus Micrarchaeota archaeon CG1_02_60_51]|nr:MAG: hypothetical protein AUJ16_00455 [Candidatus Micrarchaeota archaeon CG1_02_60_51]
MVILRKANLGVASEIRSVRNWKIRRIKVYQVPAPSVLQHNCEISAVKLVLLQRPVYQQKILTVEYPGVGIPAERNIETTLGIYPIKSVESGFVKENEASGPFDFRRWF